MDNLDSVSRLMTYLQDDAGRSILAQQIIDAHLLSNFVLLSIIALFFMLGVGMIKSATHRNGASGVAVERQRNIGYFFCFICFVAGIYPIYQIAEGFLFPKMIILKEISRLLQ